ncbi:MAG: riboflavin deaminase, partial [Armatimonadetes bacterium]|nr:riboflavin deaminase [Armatimonadota bacterium]
MPVTMVMGMTADGKIGRVSREAINLGPADRRRLEAHCAAADVVIMGAGALRSYGTTPSIRQPELLAQ